MVAAVAAAEELVSPSPCHGPARVEDHPSSPLLAATWTPHHLEDCRLEVHHIVLQPERLHILQVVVAKPDRQDNHPQVAEPR